MQKSIDKYTNHIETLYLVNGVWMIFVTVYIFILTYKKLI